MLLERRECACGIRFTPERETQTDCSDCLDKPKRKPQDSFAVPDANGERVEAEEYW